MNLNKTIITYALFTVVIFLFARIYTFFGHGVTSSWMSNAYLYVLGLGVGVFGLLKITMPDIGLQQGGGFVFRVYNSGVAVLINGMLLLGILDIAGSSSPYVSWFFIVGWGLIAMGVILFFAMLVSRVGFRLRHH